MTGRVFWVYLELRGSIEVTEIVEVMWGGGGWMKEHRCFYPTGEGASGKKPGGPHFPDGPIEPLFDDGHGPPYWPDYPGFLDPKRDI